MITNHKELIEALNRSNDIIGMLRLGLIKRSSCLKCGRDFFSYKDTGAFCKDCIEKIKNRPKLRSEL